MRRPRGPKDSNQARVGRARVLALRKGTSFCALQMDGVVDRLWAGVDEPWTCVFCATANACGLASCAECLKPSPCTHPGARGAMSVLGIFATLEFDASVARDIPVEHRARLLCDKVQRVTGTPMPASLARGLLVNLSAHAPALRDRLLRPPPAAENKSNLDDLSCVLIGCDRTTCVVRVRRPRATRFPVCPRTHADRSSRATLFSARPCTH